MKWQARLAGLQDQVLEITMSLADLRGRQETAKGVEATIMLEISRHEEAEKREESWHIANLVCACPPQEKSPSALPFCWCRLS